MIQRPHGSLVMVVNCCGPPVVVFISLECGEVSWTPTPLAKGTT